MRCNICGEAKSNERFIVNKETLFICKLCSSELQCLENRNGITPKRAFELEKVALEITIKRALTRFYENTEISIKGKYAVGCSYTNAWVSIKMDKSGI